MKKLLLLISLLSFSGLAYSQDTTAHAKHMVKKKVVHKKKHTVIRKKTEGEVIHGAPNQARLDSIKKAKTKQKR